MGTSSLVEHDLEAGRNLLKALDEASMEVSAAMWFWFVLESEWRYVIATPRVDKEGPLQVYNLLGQLLARVQIHIDFNDLWVVPPDNENISMMRKLIKVDNGEGVWLRDNWVDNLHIASAYVYRLK